MTTTKWTCDTAGNWRLAPVILERKGAGWAEVWGANEVAVAGATAEQRRVA